MVVPLGQQYNIGEKPTVILYSYINRHAGTPEKQQRQKRLSTRMSFMGRLDTPSFVADLNAWIVVLCSEHEEYRETVDLTS